MMVMEAVRGKEQCNMGQRMQRLWRAVRPLWGSERAVRELQY